MKVVHMISGGETGGSRKHVISLLSQFPNQEVSLVVFQKGQLYDEAIETGIDVHLLEQKSRYDLTVLAKLRQFINENNFSIMHTHGPRANLYGAFIKKSVKAKWLTTIHSDPKLDFMKSGIKGYLFTKLNLWAIQKIDFFFAVSERFADHLVELGIDRKKIKTIYNGIDFSVTPDPSPTEEHAVTREKLDIDPEAFTITMVARLHPVKGHEIVFEAIKSLPKKNKLTLLLVGDGPIEAELKEKANQHNVTEHVRFLGFRNDVEQLLKISDVSLMASYSESFPLALLESAKVKTPVITTDVGGVKQLITDRNMGWVVNVGDKTSLAAAFEEAMNRKDELPQMGANLHAHAASKFSLQQLYTEIKETYLKGV